MKLSDLEAELAQHLEDRRYWAVYADALEMDQQLDRASLVRRALAEDPALPGPALDPEHLEVEWRFGHWRAAWLRGEVAAQRLEIVLEHSQARFLEHLVLDPEVPLAALSQARLPPLLARLDLLGHRMIELSDLGPLLDQLQVLSAPGLICRLRPGRHLVRVALEGFRQPPPEALPRLEVLELDVLPKIEHLTPELFPALHTLCLRGEGARAGRGRAEALEALLDAPIARQLKRLEIPASGGLLEILERNPRRWESIDQVIVDLPRFEAPRSSGRLILRAMEAPVAQGRYLRLAPPANGLKLYRSLREACEALDLRIEADPAAWIEVPSPLALPLARAVAARSGGSAHVLEVGQRVGYSRADLEARATELTPDGFEFPVELDLTRAELSYDDEVEGNDRPMSEEELYDVAGSLVETLFAHTTVDRATLWVPSSFRPDPWTLGRPALAPRELACAGRTLSLPGELGPYLAFRARVGGALLRCPIPDLSRWTERLLRRHGLEREPEDPGHPFWADWEQRTRPERALRSDEGTIPHYKLLVRGRWLLVPEEIEVLRAALGKRIEHHQVPSELERGVREVLGWLAEEETEVEVE